MRYLRWLLVLPLLLACIYAGVVLGMLILRQVLHLCGAQLQPGLLCTEPWYPAAETAVAAVCAALAVFAGVLLAAAAAPSHKRVVAAACAFVGVAAVIAILILLVFSLLAPVAAAIAAGALASWLAVRHHDRASRREV